MRQNKRGIHGESNKFPTRYFDNCMKLKIIIKFISLQALLVQLSWDARSWQFEEINVIMCHVNPPYNCFSNPIILRDPWFVCPSIEYWTYYDNKFSEKPTISRLTIVKSIYIRNATIVHYKSPTPFPIFSASYMLQYSTEYENLINIMSSHLKNIIF